MDILKIRKKRARERGAEETQGTDTAETQDSNAPVQPEAAAEASVPAEPVVPTPTAPTPTAPTPSAPRSTPEPDASTPTAPAVEGAGDPLREFLARYDETGDGDDLIGPVETTKSDDGRRFLAFQLAGEAYAANILDVREILRAVALTEVPRAPIQILGVLSKRGVVMPVVDLAATLGLRPPDQRHDPRQRVLVVGEGERVCGLRVDSVQEVVRLQQDQIEEVPASLGSRLAHQLGGIGRLGDHMYILLDVQAVQHGLAVSAGVESREEG